MSGALARFEDRLLRLFAPGVTDLWLRPDDTRLRSGRWNQCADPWSTVEIGDFAHAAAANDRINLNASPVCTAYTPKGLRAQIQAPAATHTGWSIHIRRADGEQPTLLNYVEAGAFDSTKVIFESGPDSWKNALDQRDFLEFFRLAFDDKANFAVVGLSGSGKTRFMNALLQLILKTEKIMIVEEGPEIVLDHPLMDRGRISRLVSGELLTGSSQRSAVERLIFGEVIDGTAYDMVNAWLTLGGGVCSAHAASVFNADDRFAFLARQHPAGVSLPYGDLLRMIKTNLHIVLSIKKNGEDDKRRIDNILVRGQS